MGLYDRYFYVVASQCESHWNWWCWYPFQQSRVQYSNLCPAQKNKIIVNESILDSRSNNNTIFYALSACRVAGRVNERVRSSERHKWEWSRTSLNCQCRSPFLQITIVYARPGSNLLRRAFSRQSTTLPIELIKVSFIICHRTAVTWPQFRPIKQTVPLLQSTASH